MLSSTLTLYSAARSSTHSRGPLYFRRSDAASDAVLYSLGFGFIPVFTKADSMSHKLFKNLIGSEWVAAKTGKTFLNINPADKNDIVGEFQSSGADDIDG